MAKQKPMFEDDVPVLDEIVDPSSDRGRLVNALDELAKLIDHVPRAHGLGEEEIAALKDDLVSKLSARVEELIRRNAKDIEAILVEALAARLKRDIPVLVERTLKEHLEKKNGK